MKQVAAVGIGQEIALQLDTDIAAVAGVGTSTVIETCDGGGNLAVAHEPLIYWVHGILKREWTLEPVSYTHLNLLYLSIYAYIEVSFTPHTFKEFAIMSFALTDQRGEDKDTMVDICLLYTSQPFRIQCAFDDILGG